MNTTNSTSHLQNPNEYVNPGNLRRQAVLLLVLTAVLWSTSGVLIKIIGWQALSILSARSIFATVIFVIYLRRFDFNWTKLQIIGAVGYASTQLFFIVATKLTAAANAIFLQYTAPLYVGLFGYWLLGERPRRADWGAMAVIFTGMVLFFGDDLSLNGLYGNVFGVLSGVTMAVMILCMRGQKDGVPANTILLGNLICAFMGLPFLLQETFSPSSLGIVFYLGTIQIGLSFIFYSNAIKHVQALESILVLTMEPILNPIWVLLVIGEMPGPLAFVGGGLVIGAVIIRAIISARSADGDIVLAQQA